MCSSALWVVTVSKSSPLQGERERRHLSSIWRLPISCFPLVHVNSLGELTPLYDQLPHPAPSQPDRSQSPGPVVCISSFFAESIRIRRSQRLRGAWSWLASGSRTSRAQGSWSASEAEQAAGVRGWAGGVWEVWERKRMVS